jgi:hypothetical protein|tara:strand:- start:517 stop:843 length:327 start_codon:yes stop_codon:yes gene_type:complete
MGKKIKLTKKQLGKVVSEAMGFSLPTYNNQTEEELDSFIDVVSGPISGLRKEKSFGNDSEDPTVQRIYQLVAEGGELHILVQELIDLLENLDDKPPRQQLGYKTSNYG